MIFKDKKLLSFILMFALFIFLFYASIPFLNAFFGALILFVIFKPLNRKLKTKFRFSKSLAAWTILLISSIIIIIPLFFLVQGLISQISTLPEVITSIDEFESLVNTVSSLNLEIKTDTIINQIIPFIEKSVSSIFENAIILITNIVLFYFLLYYMLVNGDDFINKIKKALPFTQKNKERIINKFSDMTKATIIGSLLIAILQGAMLWVGFHFLGIPGALFWGLVTALISFIPIVGSPVIWVPASIILLFSGNVWQAVALLLWGLIISSVDNVIRPITNKKFGKIHPLISIIGVFVGISQFGFLGIFIGPLLVAYFVLIWDIYREEHLI
ncbi:AI-2E family transporter [Candidatus Woesearchaeota archaeon]|jgi:predicted PurR-regulated permease PerM|nr:AI-2E family transporter [Candidatus Woesearchaeota archaeon]MBT7237443.1 AI-2E family transporter [Candidatus Woesearchaeota archaeon]